MVTDGGSQIPAATVERVSEAPAVSQRVIDEDGHVVEIFPLPADEGTLERVLREHFEVHWDKIVFGPIIQGGAWEFQAPHAPTHVGVLDGYLTVAFGAPHFHLCIGPTKGSRTHPTPRSSPNIAAAHKPSSSAASTAPGRQVRGACVCGTAMANSRPRSSFRIPSSPPTARRSSGNQIGHASPSGTRCGPVTPGSKDPIRWTAPALASATTENAMFCS
jgi:hypothetical protein